MSATRDGLDGVGAPHLPPGAPPAFHLLAKPTGSVCNLDCAYCFFLEKEKLYPGARSRMSDELLERYIRQLIEGHLTPDVTIAWQGGEPMLMGLEFFRRAVELAKRHARPGFKAFFHHVDAPLRRMCVLLGEDRAPSEIVAEYAGGRR